MRAASTHPDAQALQDRLVGFIRAFGLHQPERTPCGQPIPVSEAHALAELARDPPLGQAELARRLGLEKSTVSRLVGQLAGRGWLHRRPDPDDGRATLLALTPTGQQAAADLAAARAAKFTRLLDRIPPAERAAVLGALATLTEALR
jgi:DNA-binding MarR family transcriptional regulator